MIDLSGLTGLSNPRMTLCQIAGKWSAGIAWSGGPRHGVTVNCADINGAFHTAIGRALAWRSPAKTLADDLADLLG